MTFGMNTNATYDSMNNFNAYARVIAKGTDIFMITADRPTVTLLCGGVKGRSDANWESRRPHGVKMPRLINPLPCIVGPFPFIRSP
jgi:hypothetical protein